MGVGRCAQTQPQACAPVDLRASPPDLHPTLPHKGGGIALRMRETTSFRQSPPSVAPWRAHRVHEGGGRGARHRDDASSPHRPRRGRVRRSGRRSRRQATRRLRRQRRPPCGRAAAAAAAGAASALPGNAAICVDGAQRNRAAYAPRQGPGAAADRGRQAFRAPRPRRARSSAKPERSAERISGRE